MLTFFAKYYDWIIILALLVDAILLIVNHTKLSNHADTIKSALNPGENTYNFGNDGSMEVHGNKIASLNPDDIRKKEDDFNKVASRHDVYAQMIPIFPMLGILGTVFGLVLSVTAGDIAGMMSSLDTALTSTMWGLIASIFLKFFDTVFPTKRIRDVENALDDYYRKVDIAVRQQAPKQPTQPEEKP